MIRPRKRSQQPRTRTRTRCWPLSASNAAASQASIATAMGWKLYNGEPNKMKAGRCIKALVKAKLIKLTRAGRYKLTPEGEEELKGEADD